MMPQNKETLAQARGEVGKGKGQLWIGGGSSFVGSFCGLAFAGSNYAWSLAYAYFSARLAHKTEELAIYSGKQFTELWANYYTGKEVTLWRNS